MHTSNFTENCVKKSFVAKREKGVNTVVLQKEKKNLSKEEEEILLEKLS